jgi:hypothetical protein
MTMEDKSNTPTEAKRKAGRPKGAKNKSTLLAERLLKSGIGRGQVGALQVNPKKVRLAEKRLNELLRDRSLTINQVLFAVQLVALFNGLTIPLGLSEWEKRTLRAMIEDRTLLRSLKNAVASDDEREAEAAERQKTDFIDEALKTFLEPKPAGSLSDEKQAVSCSVNL